MNALCLNQCHYILFLSCVLPKNANENKAMIQIHKQPLACKCALYVPRNSGRNTFQNNYRFVK